MADVVLYGEKFWYSPYVFSAFVALREKGVAFEVQTLSLGDGEQHHADFEAETLTARVPALRHRDFWVAESSAIAEYVDEAFEGPALFPREPRARARARQVMAWIRSDLLALREERPTTTMFFGVATTPLTPKGQAAADKLVRVAGQLIAAETELGPVAEADLAFVLHRLIVNGHPVPANVRAFAERVWARLAVTEFVQHARPPFVPYG